MSCLIGLAGFTIWYTDNLLPNIFISAFSFIRKFIITLSKFMGVSDFPETETHFQENPTRIPLSTTELIRELFPVIEIPEASATVSAGNREIPESCAVCLCEYLGGEEIRCLRMCKHVFHRSCLDCWMDRDRWTCPLCRTPILPPHLRPELYRRPIDTSNFVAANVFVDRDAVDHGM